MSMRVVQCCAVLVLGSVALGFANGCAEEDLVANDGMGESGGDETGGASSTTGVGGSSASGSSAVGGSSCEGEGQTLPPEDAVALDNPEGCPTEVPTTAPCDLTEGSRCRYASASGEPLMEYECLCSLQGSTRKSYWNCTAQEALPSWCQELTPEDGVSCSGHRGQSCKACDCSDDNVPTWNCVTPEGEDGGEWFVPELTLDGATQIKALTDAERNTLCQWLHDFTLGGTGYPDRDEQPLDAEGYTTNVGCTAMYVFPNPILIPQLPIGQCEGNLSISSCDATIEELMDCLVPLWPEPEGLPFPGCGPYLAHPGCNGTVVNLNPYCKSLGSGTADMPACDLRVR